MMSITTAFGLKENPFSTLPGAAVKYWAGMPKIRLALEDVVSSVRPDDIGAREFVVICGDWGSGKTHALRYFADQINNPANGEPDSQAIYMREIMLGGKNLSFDTLYSGIIAQLSDDAVRRTTNAVKTAVSKCIAERGVNSSDHHDLVSAIIKEKVPQDDRKLVRALYDDKRDALYNDKRDGKAIPAKALGDVNAAKMLASIFRVMTTPIDGHPPAFQAVYLFLDEVEFAFHTKAAEQLQFYHALRSLINEVTEHFALILSISEASATVEAVLSSGLQRRFTRPLIECGALSVDDAKVFVKEYLNHQRPEGYSPPQPFYPFSEAAIDVVFERESNLVPNNILRHLRGILERSIRREKLEPKQEISREMAENIMTTIGF